MLQQLLCGQAAAAHHLANDLRVDAHGHTTFGRTDAVDLFTAHPLVSSDTAQWVTSPHAIALFDETNDGRSVGAIADLVDGVIARLWVITANAPGAVTEPAVAVARDDFMSQLRQRCHGEAVDHPGLQREHWPRVVALGHAALESPHALIPSAQPLARPTAAASSSQAWVVRAFSAGDLVVALYRLRLQATGLPRVADSRWALAMDRPADGFAAPVQAPHHTALLPLRLAVSDPLPEPAPVAF